MTAKIFIVETISTFKITYAIRGESLEHAMDTVALEEADELKQNWLGETILGGREVTEKQFLKMECSETHMEKWTDELKHSLIHSIDYSR